jgi:hypothetical protein
VVDPKARIRVRRGTRDTAACVPPFQDPEAVGVNVLRMARPGIGVVDWQVGRLLYCFLL